MAIDREYLIQQAKLIRDEYRKGANTAHRVGSLLVGIIEALSDSDIVELANIFLRKDQPDTAAELITFLKGWFSKDDVIIGAEGYAEGFTGFGTKFGKDGSGEMSRLTLRHELRVPSIVFNQTEILVGDKWRAPGAGVIERVFPDYDEEGNILNTGTFWLKLEKGQIGAVFTNAICMGIFHDWESTDNNATEDTDDSRGNRTYAGFTTSYFTITEVSNYVDDEGVQWQRKQCRYQIRPISERWSGQAHPFEQMNFVCYGIFSDDAELLNKYGTSVYETRTYRRMLWKQNTWEISASNIAYQDGELSNLNIHGMQMDGYSTYLNSVYFTGTIKQVKPDGTPVRVANDRDDYVPGYECAYYDRVPYNGSLWLCINENGTNTIPAKGNSDWLLQVAAGDSLTATGRFSSAKAPFQPSSLVEFADKVWISMEVTSNAPYDCWTDENGNRLLFDDGGFIIVDDTEHNKEWNILIDISGFTNGADGEGLIVQYSSDKTNWHSAFVTGDIYMRQKVGDSGTWSEAMRIVGEDGQAKDGVYTDFQFAVGDSLIEAPTSGWQDAPSQVGLGQYLWMRVSVVDPNKGTQTPWEVTRIGGEKGNGISKVTEYYQVSASNTTAPTSWKENTMPSLTATNKYMWNYETITYTDGSKESTTPIVIGMYSKDGNGIKSITETYGLSSSANTQPTSWVNAMPTPTETQRYLWNKAVTTYTDGTSDTNIRIIAVQGEDGAGMSLLGKWKTGMVVPYLGVVQMGGSSWSAKVATSNPPMWCWTDENGNRLLFDDGSYILTGDENTTEYQKVASDGATGATGAKGDKGDKGEKGDTGGPGQQGIQGCIIRDSEWAIGVEYRNDEGIAGGFIDIALIRDNSTTTGWTAYKCKKTHTSSTSITTSNTTYWEEFGANVSAIFTSLIIAKNAKITFLQGNQFLIQKSNGKVTAGMSGSEEGDKTRYWAGAEEPDNAPFAVNEEGVTTSTKFRTGRKGARMEAKNGIISIFGQIARNIEFGVNDEGLAVLRYYDNDGTLLYDLGPTGLKKAAINGNRWVTVRLTYSGSSVDELFGTYWSKVKNPTYDTGTDRYQFLSGYINNAYINPEMDRKLFSGKTATADYYIGDGWYVYTLASGAQKDTVDSVPSDVNASNPSVSASKTIYVSHAIRVESGNIVESLNAYYN